MPTWLTILLAVLVAVAVLAIAAFAALVAYREYRRRLLLRLVVRAEGLDVAAQALIDTITRLSQAQNDELVLFAADPESPERRVLGDVASRAGAIMHELDVMPLPAALVSAAESLADAAFVLHREASRVTDEDADGDSLDHLSEIEIAPIRDYLDAARKRVTLVAVGLHMDETSVYGGGLYL